MNMNGVDNGKISDQSSSASDKFSIVRGKNGCYGLTNSLGCLVEDFRFIRIEEFQCDRALVTIRIENIIKYGFIRSNGYDLWLTIPYSNSLFI